MMQKIIESLQEAVNQKSAEIEAIQLKSDKKATKLEQKYKQKLATLEQQAQATTEELWETRDELKKQAADLESEWITKAQVLKDKMMKYQNEVKAQTLENKLLQVKVEELTAANNQREASLTTMQKHIEDLRAQLE